MSEEFKFISAKNIIEADQDQVRKNFYQVSIKFLYKYPGSSLNTLDASLFVIQINHIRILLYISHSYFFYQNNFKYILLSRN